MSKIALPGGNIPITSNSFSMYAAEFPALYSVRDTSILDVGCGASSVGRELEGRNIFYVGIDEQSDASASAVQATGEYLPFADDSFDVVMALRSLPCWARSGDQVKRFMQECGRVARKSILIAPNEPSNKVIGGFDNMLAIDAAFQDSILALRALGWTNISTKAQVTNLHRS